MLSEKRKQRIPFRSSGTQQDLEVEKFSDGYLQKLLHYNLAEGHSMVTLSMEYSVWVIVRDLGF